MTEFDPTAGGRWTRDDLPSVMDLVKASVAAMATDLGGGADAALDAVLAHLNTHHPKPDDQCEDCGVDEALEMVGNLGQGMRRAQNQRVEFLLERDAAVARAEKAESERDHGLMEISEFREELAAAYARAEKAERGRDEWKARAEAAEARTAPAVPLHQPDGTRMDASHLPIDADDDPAVFVVRESDIAAVGIERDKDQGWTIPGRGWGWVWHSTAEELREYARENCDRAAACEAVARAIEAEQATDPVEELAEKIETATRAAVRQVCDDLAGVAPSLDPLAVEQAMEVTAVSRKVAAHVLGQEADQ